MQHLVAIVLLLGAQAQAPAAYPQTLREVPAAFRGGWDEIDDCSEREPRFSITATSFYNFEVRWQVREVRMLSPTEIDIVTLHDDPDRGVTGEEEIWTIRLVDGGRAITGRNGGTPDFPRCADTLGRE